jgi:hypothetical protein
MTEILKIVSQRLQTVDQLSDHPDPNLLSAFVERSLGRRERMGILDHLSGCATCREVVSLAATQPETSAVVSTVPASSGWLSLPALRWVAAMACVLVVGTVVTLHQRREEVAAIVSEQRPKAEAQGPVQNGATDKVDAKVASLQIPNSDSKTPFTAKQPAGAQKATAVRRTENDPVASAGPVEMADARTGSPLAGMVPGRAKDAVAETLDNQSENSMNALSAGGTGLAGNSPALLATLAPRWTLSSDGTLQRSLDSGASWQTIVVSSKTVFRALAANDLDIWVGGSAGVLFHSSDAGDHWTQVQAIANGEALEDDIIGVEFTDTLHGKLTSSMEEVWITKDAGQTWQKE